MNAETIKVVYKFFDDHREMIAYQKRGYLTRVHETLEKERGIKIIPLHLRRLLQMYRIERDCPLKRIPNTAYDRLKRAAEANATSK